MLFCPNCANILLVESAKGLRFFCQTCPYIHQVQHTYRKVVPLKRKALGAVLGSEEAWKSAETTDEPCPACGHGKAYFRAWAPLPPSGRSLPRCRSPPPTHGAPPPSPPATSHTPPSAEMIQTRSADEPSSIFYRCKDPKCKHQWQEK
jgi:DNA-directed RNA polymerase III subunit RPC11